MTKVSGIQIGEGGNEDERHIIAIPPSRESARTIRISLKQWRMFHAVVDFDGFMEAAEKLHVSQSSISHALAKLQEQLGVGLLTLKGRKAQITDEGKVLLERSRELLRKAAELEDLAESLRLGWGPEIRMMIDPDFPADMLMRSLREFSISAHNVRLRVQDASADLACEALKENTIDFAVSAKVPPGYVSSELVAIEYVPVAHTSNPLFALQRYVTANDLKLQRQITVTGANDYLVADSGAPLPHPARPWSVSSLERAIGVLSQCAGYAWLPKYKLRSWLEQDILRILPMLGPCSHTTNLYLISGHSVRGNPCATRFGEVMRRGGEASY